MELLLSSYLCLFFTGCRSDTEQPVPTPGSEVRFMVNVSDSRTFYGDETVDTDGTAVCPIY